MVSLLKKNRIPCIQPASLYCPNIYNALSLSVVLSHSHSLHRNPDCHRKIKQKKETTTETNKDCFITSNDLVITETY